MRFHCGISFSLKKIKKFIFPILLGLLSYFLGGELFGNIVVYATSYSNYDTYYDVTYGEQHYENIMIDETHTLQYFLDDIVSLANNSSNYDVLISTPMLYTYNTSKVSSVGVTINIFPKGLVSSNGFNLYFGERESSNVSRFINLAFNNNTIPRSNIFGLITLSSASFPFGNDYTTYSKYLQLKSCLEDSTCELTFNSAGLVSSSPINKNTAFNNNTSLSLDFTNSNTYFQAGYFPYYYNTATIYYASFPLIFDNNNSYYSSNYSYYYKSIHINNVSYSLGDRIPTYCELFNLCTISSPTLATYNELDDLFVSNIPVNNYSNLEVKFSFDYFIDSFPDNFHIQLFTYGRVNNGTYYSYEPITCSLIGGSAYGDFKSRNTYQISNCQGDLTRYDYLYARFALFSAGLVNNFTFSTNLGYINIAPVFNGSNTVAIMDYFSNLAPDFSVLISSPNKNSHLEYIGDDTYTLAQRINKSTNEISMLAETGVITFGTNTNSNIMLYNYTLQNNNNTDLYLFFSEGVILSFNDSGAYTYYDDSNTINTENITIKYLINISEYDSSSLTGIINNFLDDIDTSMIDMHVLLNNIYNSLPSFLNYLILALYTLFLLYLLFKLLKR